MLLPLFQSAMSASMVSRNAMDTSVTSANLVVVYTTRLCRAIHFPLVYAAPTETLALLEANAGINLVVLGKDAARQEWQAVSLHHLLAATQDLLAAQVDVLATRKTL
jgi:hypothetical protein